MSGGGIYDLPAARLINLSGRDSQAEQKGEEEDRNDGLGRGSEKEGGGRVDGLGAQYVMLAVYG